MGVHGMSIGSLIIILVIILLLLGTKRLRHLGEDLAAAIKNFRHGIRDENQTDKTSDKNNN